LRPVLGRRHGQEALVRLHVVGAAADRLLAGPARGPVGQQHEQEHQGRERGGQQERVALGAQREEPVGGWPDAAGVAVHRRAHHCLLVVLGERRTDAGAHLVRPLGRQLADRGPGRGAVEPAMGHGPAHGVHGQRYRTLAAGAVRAHGRQVHGHEQRRRRHERHGQVPDVGRVGRGRCRGRGACVGRSRLARARHQSDDVAAAQDHGRFVRPVRRVSFDQDHAVPAPKQPGV